MRPDRDTRLQRSFFDQPPDALARALLGQRLVHGERWGVIVETEAYFGPEDKASHARFGPTERTQVMFGPAGFAYVYLCYGAHQLFNIVSGHEPGHAGAVLVRALELAPGLGASAVIASGPGRLTRVLGIGREHNGVDLTAHEDLYIAAGQPAEADRIAAGPRIGVDYAGPWAKKPLRYWIVGHPAVSKPPRSTSTARRGQSRGARGRASSSTGKGTGTGSRKEE